MAKGVDIDSYDTNGLTPLMWAVIRGAGPETIRVLLALGPVFIILTDHCVSSYVYNFYQTNNYNRLKGADPDLKDRKTHMCKFILQFFINQRHRSGFHINNQMFVTTFIHLSEFQHS